MNMQRLTTDQPAMWMQVIEQCPCHDFYHLPQYHALAEDSGEGKAFLFHFAEGPYSIALPLLFRSLDGLPGIPSNGIHWQDATSVYGYAGPIASQADIPDSVVRNFQALLERDLRDLGVVSVFSRLHPILPQQALLYGMGELRTLSRTVSIDLTMPLDRQRSELRSSHKVRINKLRRLGVTCLHDRDGLYLDTFVDIHHETMRRVGAMPGYFLPAEYFHKLSEGLGERFHLVVCLHEGKVLCGAIFVECCGILQFHLGGTANAALKLAPAKLLLDDTRVWANDRNLKVLHLGGGATLQPDDPLFHFKLGFSNHTHDFTVWRWVLLDNVYRQLCAEKSCWNEQNGLAVAHAGFFPEYRASTVQVVRQQPGLASAEQMRQAPPMPQGIHS
jgi:Acetyltransferase (GNAT) domain